MTQCEAVGTEERVRCELRPGHDGMHQATVYWDDFWSERPETPVTAS